MNLIALSWKNLWHKPFSAIVSILLMSLGITIVSVVVHLGIQIENQFSKNAKDIDLVIGAKGSPKQIILSSIYHIDAPTGNIPVSEVAPFIKHPMVATAIPLAFGDSYRGFKILGTKVSDYLEHFEVGLSDGKKDINGMEVIVGWRVAERLGLSLGDHFHGTHGMEEEDTEHVHEGHSYTVVGILDECGLAMDQLILCTIESVWSIHEGHGASTQKEYTSVLIEFKNPMGMMQLPRMINEKSRLQAALPAIEINSLIHQMGIGIEALKLIATLIICISALSVFLSLLAAFKERKYELAILRSLGAYPWQLMLLIVFEALLIAGLSILLGGILSRGLFAVLAQYLDENYHYYFANVVLIKEELTLILYALGMAILAALIPSIMAFKLNISKTLAED